MTNDAFLWYNVSNWGKYGLAVPYFSNDTQSQNDTIRYLTDVVGRNLQAILWHPDARLRTPPSINTLTRIHKLCTRAGRFWPHEPSQLRSSTWRPHTLCPQLSSSWFTRPRTFRCGTSGSSSNAGLMLLSLTESMQHHRRTPVRSRSAKRSLG